MRKACAIILSSIILFGSGLADLPDVASMSFDELNTLKNIIDMEYNSRPESAGFLLMNGSYVIGRDIAPGLYYCAVIEPTDTSYTAYCYFYSDEKTFESDKSYTHELSSSFKDISIANNTQTISLTKGEVLNLQGCQLFMKSTPFSADEYRTYVFPEGTLVPEGSYVIGKDIPAGKYTVYPAKYGTSRFQVYLPEKNEYDELVPKYGNYGWIYLNSTNPIDFQMIEVEDGEIFEAIDDVIVAKGESLKFD